MCRMSVYKHTIQMNKHPDPEHLTVLTGHTNDYFVRGLNL